jgi:hypothetical protein
MREDELTLGDAMRYFNNSELNPHNELLDDFRTLLKVHRDYLNSLTNTEYQAYKERRGASHVNANS